MAPPIMKAKDKASGWILWNSNLPYICRDCGYQGSKVLVIALDGEKTEVRCPKCGSYRIHVPLEMVE